MLKRTAPGPGDEGDRSITEMIGQLFDDGRAYAQAEIDLIKARAQVEVSRYRRAAVIAAAGAAFALAALIAFAVMLVIGFARWLGPFGGGIAAIALLGATAYGLFTMAGNAVEHSTDEPSDDDIDTYD
jgi:hypothetical protein